MKASSEQTVMTLSNAVTLTGMIVQELLGNAVADTLNGTEVSQAMLFQMAATEINQAFSSELIKRGA